MMKHSWCSSMVWAACICGVLLSAGHAQQVDYGKIEPPEVFIFPTPREATYGRLDIRISTPSGAQAVIILPSNPSPTLQAAAEDLNAQLRRIAPDAQPLPVLQEGDSAPRGTVTYVLIGAAGAMRKLDELAAAEGIHVTAGEPGPQGYRIAVHEEGEKRYVLLIGSDDQGAYWAAGSFAQLLRRGHDGDVRAYSASVRDWPGFQWRMTSVEAVYESNYDGVTSMKERMARVLALKYNVSCYSGDNRELNEWLRTRGFRAGTGYWTMQHIGRKAAELGIKPYNWSDARLNEAWAEAYKRNAANSRPGLVIWHDCTDAGWFDKYIDKFWNQREEADKAAYPDVHPARADAARINLIYDAVKSVSPDTQLYFTVPCYYDNPQDDSLPYIELFRDYLRTLGKLTPNDIVWVLEDRGPASIVAYSHYLEGRCVNYRYPLPGQGGFWSTNFTSAKAAAGYTDAYWFCVGHYEQDLLLAGGAQYMWNPELPTDYEYIVKVMVPQACKFLYGSAWREMAEFFVNVNVNDILLQRAKQVAVVRAGQEKVRRAIELLTAARDKVEPALADGRIGIERLLARMQAAEQWLGMRLAISEALDRCQRAETLIAFEQSDKAQEVLAEAEELLGRLEAGKVGQYSWLKGDYEQATARCKKLKEVISKGESAEASLFVLPLDGQWRFRLDPEDIGREEKWFAVDCDRSDWGHRLVCPQFQGATGVAWAPDRIARGSLRRRGVGIRERQVCR